MVVTRSGTVTGMQVVLCCKAALEAVEDRVAMEAASS